MADSEPLYEYIRRHRDHLTTSGAEQIAEHIDSLHAIAVSQAKQGNWFPMRNLLLMDSPLTREECWLLSQLLNGEWRLPRRSGRPHAPPLRDWMIAHYCKLLERDEKSTEAAVKKTMALFHVSRAVVFDVRGRRSLWSEAVPNDPEALRSLIAAIESEVQALRERAGGRLRWK